ncbi:MAG: GC-type dockerin domain-anchored protein [Phycisphaerales bacterium JB037]
MPVRKTLILVALCGTPALAQWDPQNGQWGKTDPTDLRVMTWNVQDAICSTNNKDYDFGDWNAVVHIIASLRPDVLILQECGDNSGNGTGSGVDSVANLTTTLNLMINGGNDPFRGNVPVTSYIKLISSDPTYDLPHIYVTTFNDNFNRNVILSRYPFSDLNGDGVATYPDIPFIAPDEWAVGGRGGIRGFQFVEIDLPNDVYAGDLVIGNAHLKSGGDASDHTERVNAARNVSYLVQYWYNGNGTGSPDPNAKVLDSPAATAILNPNTPVILGGDLNEDESKNGGTRGPADYLKNGGTPGGTDGTDRDNTDSTFDNAADPFNGTTDTQSSSKLDYLVWQDSIANLRLAFNFDSVTANTGGGLPPETLTFPNGGRFVTGLASDHRPVIADFILPLGSGVSVPGEFALVSPADNILDVDRDAEFTWTAADDAETYTLTIRQGNFSTGPIVFQQTGITSTSFTLPDTLLDCETVYEWGVTAINTAGSTPASNQPFNFYSDSPADLTNSSDPNSPNYGIPDGDADGDDFFFFLDAFATSNLAVCDFTGSSDPNDPTYFSPDGDCDGDDFFIFLDLFAGACP